VSQFHPLYKDKYVCIVIFSSNLTRVCFCILLISFCSAPPIAFFDSLRLERVDCHVFFDLDRHMSLAEKEQWYLDTFQVPMRSPVDFYRMARRKFGEKQFELTVQCLEHYIGS